MNKIYEFHISYMLDNTNRLSGYNTFAESLSDAIKNAIKDLSIREENIYYIANKNLTQYR